jgi:hypothetical protein
MLRQRIARHIDDVVEKTNGRYDRFGQCRRIKAGTLCKRLLDELRQIDRAEIARTIGRQWNLAARVRRRDCLAVREVVHPVDAVHKEHARLRGLVSGPQNLVPQEAGRNGAQDIARHWTGVPRPVAVDELFTAAGCCRKNSGQSVSRCTAAIKASVI